MLLCSLKNKKVMIDYVIDSGGITGTGITWKKFFLEPF